MKAKPWRKIYCFCLITLCAVKAENLCCVSNAKLYFYKKDGSGALAQLGRSDVFQEKWCDAVNACEKILKKRIVSKRVCGAPAQTKKQCNAQL